MELSILLFVLRQGKGSKLGKSTRHQQRNPLLNCFLGQGVYSASTYGLVVSYGGASAVRLGHRLADFSGKKISRRTTQSTYESVHVGVANTPHI